MQAEVWLTKVGHRKSGGGSTRRREPPTRRGGFRLLRKAAALGAVVRIHVVEGAPVVFCAFNAGYIRRKTNDVNAFCRVKSHEKSLKILAKSAEN